MPRRSLALLLFLIVCLPVVAQRRRAITAGDSGRCATGTIAEINDPVYVALDETHVYTYNDFSGQVERVPKRGGTVEELYPVMPDDLPFSLAVDETNVYVGAVPLQGDFAFGPGNIVAVSKNGGQPHNVATGVLLPNEIVTDATHVYWVSLGTINFLSGTVLSDGKIERARRDGTGRQTLAEGLSVPYSLLLDGETLFYSELGQAVGNSSAGVRKMAKSGGTVQKVTDGWIAADLQQTSAEIVFLGGRTENTQVGIHAVSKNGGAVRTIVLDEDIAAGPRVFDGSVYYTTVDEDGDDQLMRVPVSGGQPVFLRTALMGYPDFEVDGCAVYYGYYPDLSLLAVPR